MPIQAPIRLKLLRVIALLAGADLTYLWVQQIQGDLWVTGPVVALHALTYLGFVWFAWRAWQGSVWASVAGAGCAITLLLPFDSFVFFLVVAMGGWKPILPFLGGVLISPALWILLAVATRRYAKSSSVSLEA